MDIWIFGVADYEFQSPRALGEIKKIDGPKENKSNAISNRIKTKIIDNKSNIGREKTPNDYNPTVDKSDTLPTSSVTSEKLKEMQSPIEKLNLLELQNSTEVDTHMNTSPKGKKKKVKAKNLMSKNVIPKDENPKDQIEITNKSVLEPYEKNELPSLNLKTAEYNNKPKSRIEQELDFQYLG